MSYLVVTLVCLVGSALFSGFENGILAIRRARLDHAVKQGSRSARLLAGFLARPAVLLGTVLLGNNLCNSFAAVFYDEWLRYALGDWMSPGTRLGVAISLVASALLTIVLLVGGEITPKVWFRQRPLVRSSRVVIPIYLFSRLAWPFVQALTWISGMLNRLLTRGAVGKPSDVALMREDFRMMLVDSEEAGALDAEARRLLDNSLDYHRRHVGAIMTPSERVDTILADATLHEAVRLARQTGRSRFPILDAAGGRWIGIFSLYDALYTVAESEWANRRVRDHLRPLVTILASDGLGGVLTRSRAYQCPLLVVADEHGKHLGIVTASDVILSLFGELNA